MWCGPGNIRNRRLPALGARRAQSEHQAGSWPAPARPAAAAAIRGATFLLAACSCAYEPAKGNPSA